MICNKCGMQNADNAVFCHNCGENFEKSSQVQSQNAQQSATHQEPPQQQQQQQWSQSAYNPQFAQQVPYRNPYDHTAEYDQKEISDNKIYAVLPYLLGWIGVLVALLACRTRTNGCSYIDFHVKQALRITVVNTLLGIIALALCWTFVAPVICAVCMAVMWIIKIIGFFSVCRGNAKELPIIRGMGFLN